jgi:hypothetical protein
MNCDGIVAKIESYGCDALTAFSSSLPHATRSISAESFLLYSLATLRLSAIQYGPWILRVGPYVLVRTDLPSRPRVNIGSQLAATRSRLIPRHPIFPCFIMSTSGELCRSVTECVLIEMVMYISDCTVCRARPRPTYNISIYCQCMECRYSIIAMCHLIQAGKIF